jgi:integrase
VTDLVFHRAEPPIGDFKRAWGTALEKARLTHAKKVADGTVTTVHDRCFHDLRRTAARNLVRNGVREGAAMAVTGHKTRAVFDRYAIIAGDEIRGATDKVSTPARA